MTRTPPQTPSKPPLPWITKRFISVVTFLLRASIRRDGSVNRCFLSLFDLKAKANPVAIDGVVTSDHTVDPTRNLKVRLFSPSPLPSTPIPVIVYFHGGGFVFHSAFTGAYDALCRRFCRQICCHVVSVDYRLAPEHRHPAAFDDGVDVLRWLDSGDILDDLSAVFLAGDSAGGSITHHVARMSLSCAFKRLSLIGMIAIQPFFSGEEETESEKRLEGVPFGSREMYKWMWRTFLPIGSGLDHEAANVFGPGSRLATGEEEWSRYPRTMVVIGGFDTLQDRQRWYVEGLRKVGVHVCEVEYATAIHGFYAFKELKEAKEFMSNVRDFVTKRVEENRLTSA